MKNNFFSFFLWYFVQIEKILIHCKVSMFDVFCWCLLNQSRGFDYLWGDATRSPSLGLAESPALLLFFHRIEYTLTLPSPLAVLQPFTLLACRDGSPADIGSPQLGATALGR